MKRLFYFITSIVLFLNIGLIDAENTPVWTKPTESKTGLLFNIVQTGSPATVDTILCLNAVGQLSCQNYRLSSLSLQISTVTAGPRGQGYPRAGIKILTPGYIIQDTNLTCTPIPNGYCVFTASQSPAKQITLRSSNSLIAAGNYLNAPTAIFPLLANSTNNGPTWNYTITSNPATLPADYRSTLPALILGNIFLSTTCDGLKCIVAGQYNNGPFAFPLTTVFPLLATSNDGGTNWTYRITSNLATLPAGYIQQGGFRSVYCDKNNCVVAGDYKRYTYYSLMTPIMLPVVAHSIDNGVTWTYNQDLEVTSPTQTPYNFANNGTFKSTICSGAVCLAAGKYDAFIGLPGMNFFTYPLLANSIDGGTTWAYRIDGTATPPGGPGNTTLLPADYVNAGVFNSVSCNGYNCIAAGVYATNYNGSQTYPLLSYSINGGTTWAYVIDSTPASLPADYTNGGVFSSTSCANQNCVAAGQYSNSTTQFPMLAYSANGGISWRYAINSTPNTLPVDYVSGGIFNSVTCSQLNCVAGGQYLNNETTFPLLAHSTDGGMNWSYSINSSPATLPADYVNGGVFKTTSCKGLNCLAAGQYYNGVATYPLLAYSQNGGTTWSYGIDRIHPALPADYVDAGTFNSVSVGIISAYLPESLRVLKNPDEEELPPSLFGK